MKMIDWLINNLYFTFGNLVFKQTIGIPMGTDCAPYLANLMLHQLEFNYMISIMNKDFTAVQKFKNIYRYIDDISILNDDGYFKDHYKDIYGKDLELKLVNKDPKEANILDLTISITDNKFSVNLYDKRADYDFTITNFPHKTSNLSINLFHNVIVSQTKRYCKICTNGDQLLANLKILINKLRLRSYPNRILKEAIPPIVKKASLDLHVRNLSTLQLWQAIA